MKFPEAHPNGFNRVIQAIAMTRLGTTLFRGIAHHLDRAMLALSGGKYTTVELFSGLIVVNVTMTGAKSGLKRTLPLAAFVEGECLYLIASNFGQAHHPGWYYNLRTHPRVTVTYQGQSEEYTACVLEGSERERVYAKGIEVYPGYALYREHAAPRQIPVLKLSPEK